MTDDKADNLWSSMNIMLGRSEIIGHYNTPDTMVDIVTRK